MAFWLDRRWQTDSAEHLKHALIQVHDQLYPKNLRDGEWTKPMFAALAKTLLDSCPRDQGEAHCSFGGGEALGYQNGWLYDLCCWVVDEGQTLIGLPAVVESEWKKCWDDVIEDFEKLVQAPSGLKVLIFQDGDVPADWSKQLEKRIGQFSPAMPPAHWLFAYWKGRQGFVFEQLQI